jgi:hypothetical protein
MGMLQKYRNKLKGDERRRKRKQVEDGEVETVKIKVKVPGVGRTKKK